MKSRRARVMAINLVVGFYISYRYGVLSCLGILIMVTSHELGHYMFAVIKGKDPEFIISSGGNFGVRYDGERELLITAGGMIINFLFLPLFIGIGMMNMEPYFIALLIIGGSLSDIVKITKELRKSE